MANTDEKSLSGHVTEPDMYAKRLAQREQTKAWRHEQWGLSAVKALLKNGFEALYVPDRQQAKQAVLERIPTGAAIGVGGSMTIRELEVLPVLAAAGHTMYDHWVSGKPPEEMLAIRKAQLTADVFLCSTNALTLQGQLVNVDGIGNRVAAMTFGPGKVIVVTGVNKITADLDAAMERIQQISSPLTLRDTGLPLPCVQTGRCGHCHSESRLCRATLILDCRPLMTDMSVIVVGEELGF